MNDTSLTPRNVSNESVKDYGGVNEETVDKLVHECLKLKKKNKEMKVALLGYESSLKESELNMRSHLANKEMETERMVSQMKAQHFMELSQLRDYRVQEVDELTRQLTMAKREISQQNPLILSMTTRIDSLEAELSSEYEKHQHQLAELRYSMSSEKNQMLESHNANAENQRKALEHRATMAENEASSLSQQLAKIRSNDVWAKASQLEQQLTQAQTQYSALENQYSTLQKIHDATLSSNQTMSSTYEDLRADLTAKQDELHYYREENARLEKQVTLIKSELEQQHQQQLSAPLSASAEKAIAAVATAESGTNTDISNYSPDTTNAAAEKLLLSHAKEAEMQAEITRNRGTL